MNLHKLIFTKCDAYKAGRKITPKGIMVHSTGANNPNLKRYVGPDDGLLGKNIYNNHWNMPGVGASVHAFIGKLKDGSIATYQVLPWNYRAGHCASSANDTHIAFEICEDGLKDAAYFTKVYKEAVELTAMLCKEYNLDPMADGVVICHSEGYKRGIASNHKDVMHWFPKHGKSMDTFRADVRALIDAKSEEKLETPAIPATPTDIKKGDIVSIAKNATYYTGKDIPDWVVAKNWIVSAKPVGDRVVIDKSLDGKHAINSPINAKFLTIVGAEVPWTPRVGDIVNYKGTKHYANANAANGSTCKGGLAKITNIYQLGKSKHPYHLVREAGKGSTVYGWVDEGSFTKA